MILDLLFVEYFRRRSPVEQSAPSASILFRLLKLSQHFRQQQVTYVRWTGNRPSLVLLFGSRD